ncbi:PTS sugar transporter subunit IIA [Enterococcus sp. ALS3]|uniref:PTS sugar transporter subunit IIA n=1 Tax=Enterococcus alishanensis TaxID=1303817 RepID=A0ABS6TFV3_9ENTE|nr:PTS sugar transporter subunit IIA [Enterococcus alishanensis]MBV7391819.1 PTS sugar transporter subunit IIA [Enterococcus alishanensis]
MSENKLYQVAMVDTFSNVQEIYQFLSQKAATTAPEKVSQQLKERVDLGSIMVAEKVALPHIESPDILTSQVLLVKLQQTFDWEKQGDVAFVIAILLKENEAVEIKKRIALFIRKLADDEFVENLLAANHIKQITEIVGEI